MDLRFDERLRIIEVTLHDLDTSCGKSYGDECQQAVQYLKEWGN
jgi:hypothetical protein